MKVTLVSLRSSFLDNDKIYPPLANLYLHQKIKETMPKVEVNITDNPTLEQMIESDFVGVSVMTPQRKQASELLDKLKGKTKTIVGGPHVKHYLDEVQKQDWDYIVPFDGIRAIIYILRGMSPKTVVDSIPVGEYPTEWVKPNRLDNAEFLREFNYTLNGRNSTTMLTAQGCPMVCSFCEEAGTKGRWTPMNLIKEELDDIVSLGYRGVYLFDDLFAIAMPKVRPICEELKKRDLIYRCNGQANFFTKWGEDFAKLLGDTGCYEIAFGHESGSQKILDTVQKRTTVEQNYRSIEYAKKHGLKVKSFVMLGLPGEDEETIKDTERFLATAGMDDFQLAIYYPYKGTQIRDAIDRGESLDLYLEGEGLGAYGQKGGSTESVVRTNRYTSKELLEIRDELVRRYKPESHTHKWDGFFEHDH